MAKSLNVIVNGTTVTVTADSAVLADGRVVPLTDARGPDAEVLRLARFGHTWRVFADSTAATTATVDGTLLDGARLLKSDSVQVQVGAQPVRTPARPPATESRPMPDTPPVAAAWPPPTDTGPATQPAPARVPLQPPAPPASTTPDLEPVVAVLLRAALREVDVDPNHILRPDQVNLLSMVEASATGYIRPGHAPSRPGHRA